MTTQWWDDLWLNEAFATWMAFKIVDGWRPEWRVWLEFDTGKAGALHLDALDSTHPIRSEVRNADEATWTEGTGKIRIALSGFTSSPDFPVSPDAMQPVYAGNTDAFVVLLDGDGRRRWATYIGGSYGDEAADVAFDPEENLLLCGTTYSTNFPASAGAFQTSNEGDFDAFIASATDPARELRPESATAMRADLAASLAGLEGYARKELDALGEKLKAERAKRADDLKALAGELKEALKALDKRLAKLDEATSGADADLRSQSVNFFCALALTGRRGVTRIAPVREERRAEARVAERRASVRARPVVEARDVGAGPRGDEQAEEHAAAHSRKSSPMPAVPPSRYAVTAVVAMVWTLIP